LPLPERPGSPSPQIVGPFVRRQETAGNNLGGR